MRPGNLFSFAEMPHARSGAGLKGADFRGSQVRNILCRHPIRSSLKDKHCKSPYLLRLCRRIDRLSYFIEQVGENIATDVRTKTG
jgi:hypothetical protein